MPWEVEELESGSKALVRLEGIVDSTNVEEFFTLINSIIKRGINRIVIDLQNTSYLSSGGLSVIVDAYKKVEKEGGKLVLAGASEIVKDLLEVAQIAKIVESYPDAEEALRKL